MNRGQKMEDRSNENILKSNKGQTMETITNINGT